MQKEHSPGRVRLVMLMLFLFMFVNFADKAVLGLTAVPMMKELNLSPREFGLIGSSFFLLFSISMVTVGFLVNRIQTRHALQAMSLVWAFAQLAVVAGAGLGTLVVSRVILGAGEGPAYPVAIHSAYKWFPDGRRSVPTAILAQGAAIGVVVVLPALGWVITHYSWRYAYGILGLLGLLWCVGWAFLGGEGTQSATVKLDSGTVIDRVDYGRLIFNPTILSCTLCGFGAYWGLALLVAWFTPYLINGIGLEASTAHLISALPWALGAIVVLLLGWFSQKLVERGVSTRLARGVLASACVALGGLALVVTPYITVIWIKIALVVIGISVPGVIYAIGPTIVGEITPVHQRGAMLAINNAVVTSAGLLAPFVTGNTIQAAGSSPDGYVSGFFICGVIALSGGIIGMIFIKPRAELERFAASGVSMKTATAIVK